MQGVVILGLDRLQLPAKTYWTWESKTSFLQVYDFLVSTDMNHVPSLCRSYII